VRRFLGSRVLHVLLLPLAVAAGLGALVGYAGAHLIRIPRVEELATYRPDIITEIRAADGSTIARYAVERRILVPPTAIPEVLKRAIVATEDKNFYHHGGIDLVRIFSAGTKDFLLHRYAEGASTLTQQLARAVFLNPQKSLARKVNEALLAVDIERRFSKDQILTLYCNQIYLGHGNYGVEAASRYYFGVPAAKVTLAQAALLAGLIQRPEEFSPFRNPEKARARRAHVLKRMVDERAVTAKQAEAAGADPLPKSPAQAESVVAPYFCEDIRQYLEKNYGEKDLYRRGLRVDSTLDPKLQAFSEEALRWGLRRIERTHGWRKARNVVAEGFADPERYEDPSWSKSSRNDSAEIGVVLSVSRKQAIVKVGARRETVPPAAFSWTGASAFPPNLRRGDLVALSTEKNAKGKPSLVVDPLPRAQGAVLILENATGAVRAMVGGYDWDESKFNRAVQAERQTGSSFKPFVYLTALENGYTPSDTLFDGPISIVIDPRQPPYRPHNYHNDYSGIVTIRRALEHSINIPAVKMARMVGLKNVVETAHRFGIREQLLAYPSIALGAFETTLWEMTTAYETFANEGLQISPYTIARVSDSEGDVLEENRPDAKEVASPQTCFQLLWMLKGVMERGTAVRSRELGLDNIAGKTGTTNEFTDAWFMGFTPKYTIGVWTGNDEKRIPLGPKMEGARAALPIWMRIVAAMHEAGYVDPQKNFEIPPNISFEPIDYMTGLKATPTTPHPILEAYAVGSQPTEEWTPRWEGLLSLPWSLQQSFYKSEKEATGDAAEPTSVPAPPATPPPPPP
jgi:penicillin-binding protein 1A